MGDGHKQLLDKYNAFDYFFYTPASARIGFCVSPGFIMKCWSNNLTFDVTRFNVNRFYFDGVSWAHLQRFVAVIKDNMTDENRYKSIRLVWAIINKVFKRKNALSYATAIDLGFYYYNIALVDDAIFQRLAGDYRVRDDIERRLQEATYSEGDLYLFDLFYSLPWCKAVLEPRIQQADDEQQKIIDAWHDEMLEKLRKRGEEITPGSLLEFVHGRR